jgi:biopolymer transport protein ExbB/TolQ
MTQPNPLDHIRHQAEEVLERRPPKAWLLASHLPLAAGLLGFYYLAAPLTTRFPRLHEILFERAFWPHAIVALAFLALADLAVQGARGWMAGSFSPRAAGLPDQGRLEPRHLAALADHLRRRPWYQRHATWVRRLALGLAELAGGGTRGSVRDGLVAQAEIDDATLASRYTLVKVYLWVIPLLGFIGTVDGIAAGIGQFTLELDATTHAAATAPAAGAAGGAVGGSLEAIRGSLQGVTQGLGRAFDTTYLALVLAVALMLVLSVVEKLETDRLLRFDEYCQRGFVARLPSVLDLDADRVDRLAESVDAFRRAVASAEQTAQLVAGLGARLDHLTDSLSAGVGLKLSLE